MNTNLNQARSLGVMQRLLRCAVGWVFAACAASAAFAPQAAQAQAITQSVSSLNLSSGGSVTITFPTSPLVAINFINTVSGVLCKDYLGTGSTLQVVNGAPACGGGLAVPLGAPTRVGLHQFVFNVPASALGAAASTGASRPRYVLLEVVGGTPGIQATYRAAARINLIEPRTSPEISEAQLRFIGPAGQQPVGLFALDEVLPPVQALLRFKGFGLLKATWEVVQPGDMQPSEFDLTPAYYLSLPERAQQRHWRVLSRVQQYFSATGLTRLPGPPPRLLPSDRYGAYTVLLRLEPSAPFDPAIGAAAAAAFVMPVLRYYIGNPPGAVLAQETPGPIHALVPLGWVGGDQPMVFTWQARPDIALYRVELEQNGNLLYAARVRAPSPELPTSAAVSTAVSASVSTAASERAAPVVRQPLPLFVHERLCQVCAARGLRWRVVSVGADGEAVSTSAWIELRWRE